MFITHLVKKQIWKLHGHHGCILPGLGTYHFSPILLPTRKSSTIRHLENGGNQNFTEAFVTLIVTM